MRFGLLSTLGLAGMLQWMTPQASAAPVMPAAIAAVMPESSADLVYYYQGHPLPVSIWRPLLQSPGLQPWPLALLLRRGSWE